MNFSKTSCCAIADITGLGGHLTAKDAMISFCQQALLKPTKFGTANGAPGEIYSFYLFTAALGSYTKPYGKNFYDFIKQNNLGEVYESPVRDNKAFHKGRGNQVYIWTPDADAIRAWWEKHDPSTPSVIAAKRTVPLVEADDEEDEDDEDEECHDCGGDLDEDGYCVDDCNGEKADQDAEQDGCDD